MWVSYWRILSQDPKWNFWHFDGIFQIKMARGQQKIQSQQKAAEKAAKAKKQAGHSAKDAAKTAAAGLKASCSVCKVRIFSL